jgi:hypothetical protein
MSSPAVNNVESEMLAYIQRRMADGALSVTEQEVLDAVVPREHPEYRQRPAYKYGLERLQRRRVINAVRDKRGNAHYFIGAYPSSELVASMQW